MCRCICVCVCDYIVSLGINDTLISKHFKYCVSFNHVFRHISKSLHIIWKILDAESFKMMFNVCWKFVWFNLRWSKDTKPNFHNPAFSLWYVKETALWKEKKLSHSQHKGMLYIPRLCLITLDHMSWYGFILKVFMKKSFIEWPHVKQVGLHMRFQHSVFSCFFCCGNIQLPCAAQPQSHAHMTQQNIRL